VSDVFASVKTANFFFPNDLKALIDIIVRELQNRSRDDKVSTDDPHLTNEYDDER